MKEKDEYKLAKDSKKIQESLISQTLSPIALFTIVRVFTIHLPFSSYIQNLIAYFKNKPLSFELKRSNIFFDFLIINEKSNFYLDIILLFCLAWIIKAIISFFSFSTKAKYGYDIKNVVIENIFIEEESNLNFFISFLLPLVANDLFTFNNFLFFLLTLVLLRQLLLRTKYFYITPMLSILKYNVFSFTYTETPDPCIKGKMIGITKQEIHKDSELICAKKIVNNIYYIYK